jgi:hypothetical protein
MNIFRRKPRRPYPPDDIPDPMSTPEGREKYGLPRDPKFVFVPPWYRRINWRYAVPVLLVLALAAFQIYRAITKGETP